jgi:hypothetical protein
MFNLSASVLDDLESGSYELARQATEYFNSWKAGQVYIPKSALRAMGRRYLYLRDADDLSMLELFEFGRLYAFFCLMYPPDGEIPSVAAIAIELCNLVNTPSPTE